MLILCVKLCDLCGKKDLNAENAKESQRLKIAAGIA